MISFVIPVLDERPSLRILYAEILEVMSSLKEKHEVVFVDDGSTDGSLDELRDLSLEDQDVMVLTFPRNQGKSSAYKAAFEICHGDLIVTMDADLQDVPAELPKLIEKHNAGYDLVVGWKQDRLTNEPSKALPSKLFNWLLGLVFGLRLHDSNCGYRLMTRAAAVHLDLRGDLYRFIPQILHIAGYQVAEVPVLHRKRQFGNSKYGTIRFWTGLLDVLTLRFVSKYYARPLHFFGSVGLVPLVIGIGLESYALAMKFFFGSIFQVHVAAIVVGVMLILGGLQCLLTGLVGEMIQYAGQKRPHTTSYQYSTQDRTLATQIVNGNEDSQSTTSNSVSTKSRNP